MQSISDLIEACKESVSNCKACKGTGEIYRGDPEFDPWDCLVCYKLRNTLQEVQKDFDKVGKSQ